MSNPRNGPQNNYRGDSVLIAGTWFTKGIRPRHPVTGATVADSVWRSWVNGQELRRLVPIMERRGWQTCTLPIYLPEGHEPHFNLHAYKPA